MWVVDTNILLYAADRSSPFHEVCRSRLERWRAGPAPVFLTWGVCYEFLRVATHPEVFPRPWSMPAALEFVGALQRSRGVQMLTPTDRHAHAAGQRRSRPPHGGADARARHQPHLHARRGLPAVPVFDAVRSDGGQPGRVAALNRVSASADMYLPRTSSGVRVRSTTVRQSSE